MLLTPSWRVYMLGGGDFVRCTQTHCTYRSERRYGRQDYCNMKYGRSANGSAITKIGVDIGVFLYISRHSSPTQVTQS